MAHRILHADLEASLLANDAFAYAHLVKFEKPIDTETGYPVKTAMVVKILMETLMERKYTLLTDLKK